MATGWRTSSFIQKAVLGFAAMQSVFVAALAAEESADFGTQFASALRMLLGVPSGPDVTVYVRFGLLMLITIILGITMTKIPIFKDKEALGGIAAVIVAYIAIRFTPDSTVWLLAIIMPPIAVGAILVVLAQTILQLIGKTKEDSKIHDVTLFIAGIFLVILGYVWDGMLKVAEDQGQITGSAANAIGWGHVAATLMLVIGIIASALTAYFIATQRLRFAKGMFKFGEAKTDYLLRDIDNEFKEVGNIINIERNELAYAKDIANTVKGLVAAIQAKNYAGAKNLLGRMAADIKKEVSDVKLEVANVRRLRNHVQEVTQRIKGLKDEDARAKHEGRADEQITKYEQRLIALTNYERQMETYFLEIERGALGKIKQSIEAINKGNYNVLVANLPYFEALAVKLETSIWHDLKITPQYIEILTWARNLAKKKKTLEHAGLQWEGNVQRLERAIIADVNVLHNYIEKEIEKGAPAGNSYATKKKRRYWEQKITAAKHIVTIMMKQVSPAQKLRELRAAEEDIKTVGYQTKGDPEVQRLVATIFKYMENIDEVLRKEAHRE